MERDSSLDTLLELDGVIFGGLAGGHWVKFDVRRAPVTVQRPHGLRYSLSLHDATGRRVFGIDNAHPVAAKKGMQTIRVPVFDHVHRRRGDLGVPYPYRDAVTLIRDFWVAVNEILREQ